MNNSNEFDLSELQRLALEELSAANVLGGSERNPGGLRKMQPTDKEQRKLRLGMRTSSATLM